MRRTAEDFSREAGKEPYELEVGSGKQKRGIAPRPWSDITQPARMELARINDVWAAANAPGKVVPPRLADGTAELAPDLFVLRWRFDALEHREPTAEDPRAYVAKTPSPDFDAFYAEWYLVRPTREWSRAIAECDEHWEPDPVTPEEKAIQAGTDLLQQCQTALQGGDVDDARVKSLLAQIEAAAERLSEPSGKSSAAAG